MGSVLGQAFQIVTWGESHGPSMGVVINGCPPNIPIDSARIETQLARRKPGQSKLTTQRQEPDQFEILSGVFEGKTLGTPIAMMTRNKDAKSRDYDHLREVYRPSHADFVYDAKYGFRDHRGGGRSSARETWSRVAAGSLAEQVLEHYCAKLGHGALQIVAWVESIGALKTEQIPVDRMQVDAHATRCSDAEVAQDMEALILKMRKQGDSIGGVIRCQIRQPPMGLGEPVFDKLDADLAKAMMSIPAVKGVEVGSGFAGTQMTGSAHNDRWVNKGEQIGTDTNRSGGIVGGISNGECIDVRIAFKPTATLQQDQKTVNRHGDTVVFKGKGRHDPCVLPRAVPIVEAMASLTVLDHWMRFVAQCGLKPNR